MHIDSQSGTNFVWTKRGKPVLPTLNLCRKLQKCVHLEVTLVIIAASFSMECLLTQGRLLLKHQLSLSVKTMTINIKL